MITINWKGVCVWGKYNHPPGSSLWTYDDHRTLSDIHHSMTEPGRLPGWLASWSKALRAGRDRW